MLLEELYLADSIFHKRGLSGQPTKTSRGGEVGSPRSVAAFSFY